MKKQAPKRHLVTVPGVVEHSKVGGVSDRHHAALHNPLPSLMFVGLLRYREAVGDVITRLVVARYRGVLEGAPLWHAVVQFATPEGEIRPSPDWTRRDRRRAVQVAEGLLANHGEGLILDGALIEGLNAEVGLHRLRLVTRAEMACFPAGYLEKPSLTFEEDADAGSGGEGPVREAAGSDL